MTNKDLLIQVLSEGTNECTAILNIKVNAIIHGMEKTKPGSTQGFYKEFSQQEAEIVLNGMRRQQLEIVDWFEGQFCRVMEMLEKA